MEQSDYQYGQSGLMNRRSFLKLSGLLGLSVASTGIIPAAAEAVKFNRKMYKVSRTRIAMGTFVTMTLIHSSKDQAEEAIGMAFQEIDRLTGLMNRFDDQTAIGRLNREGLLKEIPPEVAGVIGKGLEYYRLSRGSFDMTVKPVVDLFRAKADSRKKLDLNEEELEEVLHLVGSDKIELNGRVIRFKKPGMGITLDGIAKGYIVDRASRILVKHNIENHLINAGGDIRTMGIRQDEKPWTVAIQDPRKKREYPDIIHMSDAAIATSGNYEVYFDREKMFHHIVNPQTGLSPQTNTSVSVMAPTTMEADVLSTSVFVMDPGQGVSFINSLPLCECLVISGGDRRMKSAGWKSAKS
jgi:thiamine biosynthesis lipoprotein